MKQRNILKEYGYSEEEISQLLDAWFNELFTPGTPQCIYGEDSVGGYLIDTGNNDVRTEGQSYGMMMAVQRNRKDIFDKIWKWTKRYMWNAEGKYAGYFSWSCGLDGTRNADGPAPDGEEYFAMALFFASHRWGDGEPPLDYSVQARDILRHCLHQKKLTGGEPMWEAENHLIKFVPETPWTDPSYHLPHFYELFALWADEKDRPFWKRAAKESRKFIIMAANKKTGLCSEYSDYEGKPLKSSWDMGDTFYSDAYRVTLNIALDTLWFGERPEYKHIAAQYQKFFAGVGFDHSNFYEYTIDGKQLERKALHPIGLGASIAAATVCATDQNSEKWIHKFTDTPLRTDKRRYFDSDLCYFTLLILSGEYKIW